MNGAQYDIAIATAVALLHTDAPTTVVVGAARKYVSRMVVGDEETPWYSVRARLDAARRVLDDAATAIVAGAKDRVRAALGAAQRAVEGARAAAGAVGGAIAAEWDALKTRAAALIAEVGGAIAGTALRGVAAIGLALAALLFLRRKTRRFR